MNSCGRDLTRRGFLLAILLSFCGVIRGSTSYTRSTYLPASSADPVATGILASDVNEVKITAATLGGANVFTIPSLVTAVCPYGTSTTTSQSYVLIGNSLNKVDQSFYVCVRVTISLSGGEIFVKQTTVTRSLSSTNCADINNLGNQNAATSDTGAQAGVRSITIAQTPRPSASPSFSPTATPSFIATASPSFGPTTLRPSASPSFSPTATPSFIATASPSFGPTTLRPSASPSFALTSNPTTAPTFALSHFPTAFSSLRSSTENVTVDSSSRSERLSEMNIFYATFFPAFFVIFLILPVVAYFYFKQDKGITEAKKTYDKIDHVDADQGFAIKDKVVAVQKFYQVSL